MSASRTTYLSWVWPAVVALLSIGGAIWRGEGFGSFVLIVLLSVTLLGQLPNLLRLSIGPLSAEFREKVAEAAQIIASLKRQSGSLAHPLLDTLAWSNRMGAMSNRRRQELMLSVREELRQQGYSDHETEKHITEYVRLVGMDYSRFILGDRHPKGATEEQIKHWGRLRSPMVPQESSTLRAFLIDVGALTDQTGALLTDYEQFLRTGVSHSDFFLDARFEGVRYQLEAGVGLVRSDA